MDEEIDIIKNIKIYLKRQEISDANTPTWSVWYMKMPNDTALGGRSTKIDALFISAMALKKLLRKINILLNVVTVNVNILINSSTYSLISIWIWMIFFIFSKILPLNTLHWYGFDFFWSKLLKSSWIECAMKSKWSHMAAM